MSQLVDQVINNFMLALEREGWGEIVQSPALQGRDPHGRLIEFLVKECSNGNWDSLGSTMRDGMLEQRLQRASKSGQPDEQAVLVVASRISERNAKGVIDILSGFTGRQAIGFLDTSGLIHCRGLGLEVLNREPRSGLDRYPKPPASLITDLNLWLLKILLGQRLPEQLITVPRGQFTRSIHLARHGDVAAMTAHRFVHALVREGHLASVKQLPDLDRVRDLCLRWSNDMNRDLQQVSAWRLIPGSEEQFKARLRDYPPQEGADWPRLAIGLFAAAEELGLGHVSGVPLFVLADHWDARLEEHFEFTTVSQMRQADLIFRISSAPEALFRAAVRHNGLLVADVLQIWADVRGQSARGAEQAAILEHEVLASLWDRESKW